MQEAVNETTRPKLIPEPYSSDSGKEKECPTLSGPSTAVDAEVAARSTCPWHYVINTDPDRYPRDLMEVECNCNEGCVGVTSSFGQTQCEKVFFNVPVKRKRTCTSETGTYVWENSWQQVGVACVCAMSRVANV